MSGRFARHETFCRLLVAGIVAGVLGLATSLTGAHAQANTGCPSLADMPANITADELRCRCYQVCQKGVVVTPTQPQPQAVLNCGQIRGLGYRASVGFPEGYAAQQAAQNCSGQSDTYVPQGTPPMDTTAPASIGLNGVYRAVRGYSNPNPGVDRATCEPRYDDVVEISNGRISFNSGGHQWTGVITSNNWILVSRDGITPKPKNPTVITGPVDNASLFNGYCGRGYFRLGSRL